MSSRQDDSRSVLLSSLKEGGVLFGWMWWTQNIFSGQEYLNIYQSELLMKIDKYFNNIIERFKVEGVASRTKVLLRLVTALYAFHRVCQHPMSGGVCRVWMGHFDMGMMNVLWTLHEQNHHYFHSHWTTINSILIGWSNIMHNSYSPASNLWPTR